MSEEIALIWKIESLIREWELLLLMHKRPVSTFALADDIMKLVEAKYGKR